MRCDPNTVIVDRKTQNAIDCAVLEQAIKDLQTWKLRFVPARKGNGQLLKSARYQAFVDAARWFFDLREAPGMFCLATVCSRLDMDADKVRDAIRARLSKDQRAWIDALAMEGGSRSGRS